MNESENTEMLRKAIRPRISRIVQSAILVACFGALSVVSFASGNEPSSPESTLNRILVNARHSVESFWGQFQSVTCVERVTQEKLGKKENVEQRQRSTFDYLAFLDVENGGLSVEESRLQQGKTEKPKKAAMMLTDGMPMLLLVFHPVYREDFRYEVDGEEMEGDRTLTRIRFKHIPGRKSTTALRLRGHDYPLEIDGTAWIDSETGAVERIRAGIGGPIRELNLKSLQMDVRYAGLTFPAGSEIYWLPSSATIDIETERQHWRNLHQYTGYKRFMVNTEERISR